MSLQGRPKKDQKVKASSPPTAMAASSSDEVKKVATSVDGEEGGGQGDQAEGPDEPAATGIPATTITSTDELTLPNGVKIPKGKWTPLTHSMIQDASSSTQPSAADANPSPAIIITTDEEVQRLDTVSRAAGHDFSARVLEFLAKDVQQAMAGSISRKKIQQVTTEDLSIPKDQKMEDYDQRRAQYPSTEEMEKMSAAQVFQLLNNLQEKYPAMIRERVRAEEKLDEAEARAKRDRANLDKMKRELEEKKEARRKKMGSGKVGKGAGPGAGGDVVMGGMEEGGVAKKGEGGGDDDDDGWQEGNQKDAGEKMDLI